MTSDRADFERRELPNLAELAREGGWRTAVLSIPDKSVRNYFTDATRLAFLSLVEIFGGQKILDLNPGWGSRPAQIAKCYPFVDVHVFTGNVDLLFFLAEVKSQEGLYNLNLGRVYSSNVPVADEFFDLALLVGRESTLDQRNVLAEARRVLKRGGKLVLGTDNRYGYQHLTRKSIRKGKGSQHFPPRETFSRSSKVRCTVSQDSFLYGLGGYRALITQSGFRKASVYAAMPSYTFPNVISDIGNVDEMMKAAKLS
jgi:SAM-dependent methyltransferase